VLTKILAQKPDTAGRGGRAAGRGRPDSQAGDGAGFQGRQGLDRRHQPFTIISVAGPEAAEGVWSPANINVKGDHVSAAVRKFGETYEKRYGEVPGAIAVANYAAFDVFTQAMQKAGSVDTDKVLAVLTKEQFQTVWGPLPWAARKTYGIDRQFLYPLVISEVRGARWSISPRCYRRR